MGLFNGWFIKKENAEGNNYKLDIFNTVAQDKEIADYSAIKKYFGKLYDKDSNDSSFDAFNVSQSIDGVYASEQTNKLVRLQGYRTMSIIPEIAQAIDMICYASDIPDENNTIVSVRIKDKNLESQDIETIRDAAQEYLDLFDFDNNLVEYMRKFVVEGQLCWENIIAKDDLEQGVIGINFIPAEAYEFAFDMQERRKIGIMITNNAIDAYNIALSNGISNIPNQGPVSLAGTPMGYYQDLGDDHVMVLPFEQLTYMDSGIFSSDNKIVFSPIERARRAINQLKLIEDAVMIYRMVRSPEKYVFNVDIGRMGVQKGQQKVAQLMKQFATKKTYDPATGTVGKAYDPMQMTENFWFVKSSDSEGITVNPLQSNHNFGNLDDLEYFLKKVCRAMCIPIARYFEANTEIKTGSADGGISAEELNFAKFIMSLQKRMALGLLNGLIIHLKFKGLWDLYKLTRNKLDIIFTPPVEYQQYRRQKLLESKLTMIKSFIGDEAASNLFSEEYALNNFLGWDTDQIAENKRLKFNESIERAKNKFIIEQVEKSGKLDGGQNSLEAILQKNLNNVDEDNDKNENSQDENNDSGDLSDLMNGEQ